MVVGEVNSFFMWLFSEKASENNHLRSKPSMGVRVFRGWRLMVVGEVNSFFM